MERMSEGFRAIEESLIYRTGPPVRLELSYIFVRLILGAHLSVNRQVTE